MIDFLKSHSYVGQFEVQSFESKYYSWRCHVYGSHGCQIGLDELGKLTYSVWFLESPI